MMGPQRCILHITNSNLYYYISTCLYTYIFTYLCILLLDKHTIIHLTSEYLCTRFFMSLHFHISTHQSILANLWLLYCLHVYCNVTWQVSELWSLTLGEDRHPHKISRAMRHSFAVTPYYSLSSLSLTFSNFVRNWAQKAHLATDTSILKEARQFYLIIIIFISLSSQPFHPIS